MEPLITLDNVSVRYGPRPALQNVSARFMPGSLTAIAGPNGSGKSTLLKTIAGVLKPAGGKIVRAAGLGGATAWLPQTQSLARDFPLTVEEVAATGLYPRLGEARGMGPEERARIRAALDETGIAGLAARPIATLSGGQFQRMLFARVMLQDATLILLDEPFTAVDAGTTRRLIRLLLDWHAQGRTVICVLHDLLLIKKYFPDSMVLAGKCLGVGHTHTLFEQKLLSFDLDMAEIFASEKEARARDKDHHAHHHGHGHSHDGG